MMEHTDDIDELERRLRASDWLSTSPAKLEGDDLAIAAKILGGEAEASRFNSLKSGERFRHKARKTTKVEYYFVPCPPDRFAMVLIHSGWRIDVFENGKRREKPFALGLTDDQCLAAIRALKDHGYDPRLEITEAMRALGIFQGPLSGRRDRDYKALQQKRPFSAPRQEPSKRRAILQSLAGFKA